MCATGAEARFIEGQRPVTRKWWAAPWVAERWKVRSGSNPVSTSWFRASKYRSVKNGQLGSDVHLMIIKTPRGGIECPCLPDIHVLFSQCVCCCCWYVSEGSHLKLKWRLQNPELAGGRLWVRMVTQAPELVPSSTHYPASWPIKFLLLFSSNPTWYSTTDP